jgi:hypothetical protein
VEENASAPLQLQDLQNYISVFLSHKQLHLFGSISNALRAESSFD